MMTMHAPVQTSPQTLLACLHGANGTVQQANQSKKRHMYCTLTASSCVEHKIVYSCI